MAKREDELILGMLEKVLDKQDDTQKCVDKIDKNFALHTQKTEYELQAINKLDAKQNELLEEHMRRTELAENRIYVVETRQDKAEEPKKLRSLAKKGIISLGALAGAGYAIVKLIEALS